MSAEKFTSLSFIVFKLSRAKLITTFMKQVFNSYAIINVLPENWITAALLWRPDPLNDSRPSSQHRPWPETSSTRYALSLKGDPKRTLTIPTRKARTTLLIRRLLIRVHTVSPCGIKQ
ncbi:hypothetical protein AVEN_224394-1 [Araneus ventricosus]|uniref:Uncharacterized protein n=1 Tax=Araneus ventricosus TaxID=182803 RepID=A0A4Y2F7N6_ARAVE|nr:hypothetical protein AVEN_224394-1 [Araneus ventricosus]